MHLCRMLLLLMLASKESLRLFLWLACGGDTGGLGWWPQLQQSNLHSRLSLLRLLKDCLAVVVAAVAAATVAAATVAAEFSGGGGSDSS